VHLHQEYVRKMMWHHGATQAANELHRKQQLSRCKLIGLAILKHGAAAAIEG
jgi:hypothetical protein